MLEPVEVLHGAADDQDDREDRRERKQDAQGRAGHIHPQVSDGARTVGGEAAHQGDGDSDAHCCGQEVLHRKAGDLYGVAHRQLRRVRLPVGVGNERDRRVEREPLWNGGKSERVRQDLLDALNQVEEEHAEHREDQDTSEVDGPALLDAGVDTDEPVEPALDPQVLLRREGRCHVVAERAVSEPEQQDEGGNLRHE